jgi:hypothetical protein
MALVVQGLLQSYTFIPLMQALGIPHRFLALLEPRTMALSETLLLVAVLFATVVLATLDQRPFWTYGDNQSRNRSYINPAASPPAV